MDNLAVRITHEGRQTVVEVSANKCAMTAMSATIGWTVLLTTDARARLWPDVDTAQCQCQMPIQRPPLPIFGPNHRTAGCQLRCLYQQRATTLLRPEFVNGVEVDRRHLVFERLRNDLYWQNRPNNSTVESHLVVAASFAKVMPSQVDVISEGRKCLTQCVG